MNKIHYSVMLSESIELLNINENGIYIDATLGMGGHSEAILKRLKSGHLYSFEQDIDAIEISKNRLNNYSNFTIINSNFKNIKDELRKLNINEIDGIIYDLGVSSLQLDEVERGFSYRFDSKLDMRMNKSNNLSAYEVVNNYEYANLVKVLFEYGDEKFAKSIAKNICKQREIKVINTTFELVEIVKKSMPQKELRKKGHPAKKTFQAIRIEVNNELEALEKSLNEAVELLNVGGRIVVISFQSLEDKLAKKVFNSYIEMNVPKDIIYVPDGLKPVLKKVTRKNVKPSEKELFENNRSSSAQIRVVQKERML